ncbi:DUF3422 family protein [Sandaracinobacteroides saxicola]|uniref:DUF3422 domain-containing protein n=1 Tax=Sandaracinobacteroides saxicola TaxID=2759707 RepID=A0A7G5IKU9_9SPHN|nr:DUF3422 domain-containing protein [Sandaracinobacteroides saxicola]QMW23991.1 DUF3422 domain-containing protein [Sandaracinobacteroides saxicola]
MNDLSFPRAPGWRFHPDRDRLIAEAHARPYTPMPVPAIATRIATLSGQDAAADDRAHMAALCRKYGAAVPADDAKWCALDAGVWQLRWERHTEFSTWTFFRSAQRAHPFLETATEQVPADWLAGLPGEVLVATTLEIRSREGAPSPLGMLGGDAIGAQLLDGAVTIYTDCRPDALGMTRFLGLDSSNDPGLCGRVARSLLEIETYRMMALLAFPLAGEATGEVALIEREAAELAAQLAQEADADADRRLLARLAELAGEAEQLNARTSFRFNAATAYYRIVLDRIAGLREVRIEGLQTLGEFMERRLGPAMRTCDTVAERERDVIARIARTEQMLNTRVEVAAEATSAALLASMDRRSDQQLRLQRTVEGLSVVAMTYYAVGLLGYVFKALHDRVPQLDPAVATALSVPLVLGVAWLALRRVRETMLRD